MFGLRAGVMDGPVCVVVWPFSSVEREKMTVPWWGWVGWAAGCWASGVVCAGQEIAARLSAAIARCGEEENFMNPGLSASLVDAPAVGAASFLDAPSSVAALAKGFKEDDRGGGGDIEGADASGHGNAQQVVAGAADEVVEARTLAAEDEDAVAGEVELVVVGGAALVETDDPDVLALEFFEGADEIDDTGDAEVFGCAGAGFDGYRAEGGGAALGEDDAVDSGAVGYAQKGAEVLRVFNAVEGEEKAGGAGKRWIVE